MSKISREELIEIYENDLHSQTQIVEKIESMIEMYKHAHDTVIEKGIEGKDLQIIEHSLKTPDQMNVMLDVAKKKVEILPKIIELVKSSKDAHDIASYLYELANATEDRIEKEMKERMKL